MKVSLTLLNNLVQLNQTPEELARLLSLHTIGAKELTPNCLELDMKGYNRADLLSVTGVSLELAALTSSDWYSSLTEFKPTLWQDPNNLPEVEVSVENPDLVPLYCLAKIEGLEPGQHIPADVKEFWTKVLTESGMRSVNEIADVTNVQMLTFGQPLHAFEGSSVQGEKIVVRLANPGEKITTLDGKERVLESTDLVIADGEKVVGIAGVMGGENSEVSNSTSTIYLEAAIFDPSSIRKTASRLGLQSEASKRFQHGLSKTNLLQTFESAISEYTNMGGKLTALTIIGDSKDEVKTIKLSSAKVNNLIGTQIPKEKIEEYLKKLYFHLASTGEDWEVTVPYFRLDIECEEDLIEEVARMYGYDKIPSNDLDGELPEKVDQSLFEYIDNVRTSLSELGLTEVQTYSFFSTKVLNNFSWSENLKRLVKLQNPMSAETTYLRSDLWPNLVEVVDKNIRQSFDDIAIFEVGKVFSVVNEEPQEEYRLSIALMNGSDNPITELYQLAQKLFQKLGGEVELGSRELPNGAKDFMHPTRFSQILKDSKEFGGIGEVHPRISDKFGINKRVAVLEFKLTA